MIEVEELLKDVFFFAIIMCCITVDDPCGAVFVVAVFKRNAYRITFFHLHIPLAILLYRFGELYKDAILMHHIIGEDNGNEIGPGF